jgi:Icc-related predicted phosphoesterase
MRILTVSDVVEPRLYYDFEPGRFEGIDLVFSCGDLPPEYLSFLVHTFKVPLYYIKGNHDIRYSEKPPEGCVDLHGRLVTFNGYKILGLEGSNWYNGGPYQYYEHEMRTILRRLRPKIWWRGGMDIVITHAPPRYIHDAEDPCHRGFESYLWLIHKYNPAYFVHGHIHRNFNRPSERITVVDSTRVINTYGYNILDIQDRAVVRKTPE